MLGEKLGPILVEIEDTIFEFEANDGRPPEFDITAFRAGVKIFMTVLMDKIWKLQEEENMTLEDRCNMVEKVGAEIKDIIKTYTNIDTFELYND